MGERTLYYVNGSIPGWRVLFALYHKQLVFTGRRLRIMGEHHETRSPEFLAINPRGVTPVLIDDGVVVNESYAILQYLEARYADKSLVPTRDPHALARVLTRAYEAETFAAAYEPLEVLFNFKPQELERSHKMAVAEAVKALAREVAWWEARATEAAYIAGETFTLADVAFYPTLAYMIRRGLVLTSAPNLEAYWRRIETMSAAVSARPEGWLTDVQRKPDLFTRAQLVVRLHERGE